MGTLQNRMHTLNIQVGELQEFVPWVMKDFHTIFQDLVPQLAEKVQELADAQGAAPGAALTQRMEQVEGMVEQIWKEGIPILTTRMEAVEQLTWEMQW